MIGAVLGLLPRRWLRAALAAQWRRTLTSGEAARYDHFGATGNKAHHPFAWADDLSGLAWRRAPIWSLWPSLYVRSDGAQVQRTEVGWIAADPSGRLLIEERPVPPGEIHSVRLLTFKGSLEAKAWVDASTPNDEATDEPHSSPSTSNDE